MKSLLPTTLALCVALLLVADARAIPQAINYQGFLTDTQGVPVDGMIAMTLRLYEVESGGVALWTETKPSVAVSNGTFNVQLGSGNPIVLDFDKQYWLGVEIAADGEMQPRQRLASSPYAFRAAIADAVAPTAPVTGSQITGSITTATIPIAQVSGASALVTATCPAGMTQLELTHSTLCYAAGGVATWDAAEQFCFDSYRANLCSIGQWRAAVCRAGVPNPGASWTAHPAGTATLATVAGCTGETIGTAVYTSQRATACCLEWMKF